MRMTRVLACAILVAGFGLVALSAANAQNLSDAQTPAEFPPAAFKGKQFVDSRGCIFIRAGIDGKVTWVPRVTRNRMAICGYKPTFPTGTVTVTAPARTPVAPVRITLAPPVVAKPAPVARPAPVRVVAAVSVPAPAAPAAAPVVATVQIGPDTRIIPRHVYENRQNTLIAAVPDGYRPAWEDGRLNPHRAEGAAVPDAPGTGFVLPKGYKPAWDDGRLNPNRGAATAAGDARSDRIWSRTLPRRLRHIPVDDTRVVQLQRTARVRVPRARAPSRASRAAWHDR